MTAIDAVLPDPRLVEVDQVDLPLSPNRAWDLVRHLDLAQRSPLAQIGADRGGFYSYQWLENVAGCGLRNAEVVHPDWELAVGDRLLLHPDMPGLEVVAADRGRWLVALGAADPDAIRQGRPRVQASWLFLVEPLGATRSRLISRYRAATSPDLRTRLAFGPTILEPVGFVMDRAMLLGVKERVEGSASLVRRAGERAAGAALGT